MKTKFTPRVLVATVALCLGLGGAAAFARGPDGGHCGPRGDRMEQGMAYGMKSMAALRTDLKLDAKQEAAWQEAEKGAQSNMSGMRDQMRKQHEEMKAALNQPGADLRAIAKRMDEQREVGRKQHEANRDRWLAVYDTLTPEQKETARMFFKSKLDGGNRPGKDRPARNQQAPGA